MSDSNENQDNSEMNMNINAEEDYLRQVVDVE